MAGEWDRSLATMLEHTERVCVFVSVANLQQRPFSVIKSEE